MIFDRFLVYLGVGNPSKFDKNRFKKLSKIRCNLRLILEGSWAILVRFGGQVGGQFGAQVAPTPIKKAMRNKMHFVIDFCYRFGDLKQKKTSVLYAPGAEGLRPVLTINRP